VPLLQQCDWLTSVNSFLESKMLVTTRRVNDTARHLAIVIILNDGKRIDTRRTFEYHSNPVFTDINPRNHLAL